LNEAIPDRSTQQHSRHIRSCRHHPPLYEALSDSVMGRLFRAAGRRGGQGVLALSLAVPRVSRRLHFPCARQCAEIGLLDRANPPSCHDPACRKPSAKVGGVPILFGGQHHRHLLHTPTPSYAPRCALRGRWSASSCKGKTPQARPRAAGSLSNFSAHRGASGLVRRAAGAAA
jgi:hypothetical protein